MAKRLHKERDLELKCKALLELEKGKTNEVVASVPANTLSTWKKNQDKIFKAFREGNATTQRVIKIKSFRLFSKGVCDEKGES